MERKEKIAFLLDLVGRVCPTTLDRYCDHWFAKVSTRILPECDGIEVFLGPEDGEDDEAEHVFDLHYVRQDDLGHVVKAVRFLSDGVTKDDCLFYAHGRTLGCLINDG